MTFRWPGALLLLVLLPAGAAVSVLVRRRRARFAVSFTNLDIIEGNVPRGRRLPQRVATWLFLLGSAVLVIGVARPQSEIPVPREDATVVLVMDSSGSMISTDVAPNRLDAAKQAARTFLTVVPGQLRVGLVGFASVADVLSWPTTDRDLVRGALREIQPTGATAIGDGLMKALRVTGLSGGGEQVPAEPNAPVPEATTPLPERLFAVLLLSDGRNNAGRTRVHDAVTTARGLGVPVFTVALGATSPAERDKVPGVVEPVDAQTLRAIAERTGGAFFSAPDDHTLNAIYQDLGSRIGYELRNDEITFAFAGSAFVLLCGATLLSLLRRPALP